MCLRRRGARPRDYRGERAPMCIARTSLYSQVSSKRTATFLAYLRVYIASMTGKCVELSSRRAASDPALWSSHGRSQSTITKRKHTQIARSLCGAAWGRAVCVCVCVCVCELKTGWANRSWDYLTWITITPFNTTARRQDSHRKIQGSLLASELFFF